VTVTDGSGDILINLAGSVLIEEDGSGGVRVTGVRSSVVVSLNFASWNQLDAWLRQVEGLRAVA